MDDSSILADIPREGDDLEKVIDSVDKELQEAKEEVKTESKEPAESQPEKKEELPDKAHFLKQNEKWEEMRIARQQAEEEAQALKERISALEKEKYKDSDFVKSLVGDNEEIAQKWEQEKEKLAVEIREKLAQEQVETQKKEQEQKEYWAKWTAERLEEVEKEFNVNFKADESLKNELSKIMLDKSPTDEAGNLDYRKGMEWLLEKRELQTLKEAQKTQVKKDIADATVSKETTVKENKDYLTSHDMRKGWRSIVK